MTKPSSKRQKKEKASAPPALLALHLAGMAAMFPGGDNKARQVLAEISAAFVAWQLGKASEGDAQAQALRLAAAFVPSGFDPSRPESWLVGAISALLQGDDPPRLMDAAVLELVEVAAAALVDKCAEVARLKPAAMPRGVTAAQFEACSELIAQQIQDMGSRAIRRNSGGGTLQ